MTERATRSNGIRGAAAPPVRKRLTAEARKSSILKAARRAFTEAGDMNGTTIRVIAECLEHDRVRLNRKKGIERTRCRGNGVSG